jgi:hypothetical protein
MQEYLEPALNTSTEELTQSIKQPQAIPTAPACAISTRLIQLFGTCLVRTWISGWGFSLATLQSCIILKGISWVRQKLADNWKRLTESYTRSRQPRPPKMKFEKRRMRDMGSKIQVRLQRICSGFKKLAITKSTEEHSEEDVDEEMKDWEILCDAEVSLGKGLEIKDERSTSGDSDRIAELVCEITQLVENGCEEIECAEWDELIAMLET